MRSVLKIMTKMLKIMAEWGMCKMGQFIIHTLHHSLYIYCTYYTYTGKHTTNTTPVQILHKLHHWYTYYKYWKYYTITDTTDMEHISQIHTSMNDLIVYSIFQLKLINMYSLSHSQRYYSLFVNINHFTRGWTNQTILHYITVISTQRR